MKTALSSLWLAALCPLVSCMAMKDRTVSVNIGWINNKYKYPIDDVTQSDVPTRMIINGVDIKYGEHPYICSLQEKKGESWFFIGASVIFNQTTILTAAHCVDGIAASSLRVICGDHDRNSVDEFEVIKPIIDVKLHDRWEDSSKKGFPNDIATLKPDTPLTFNEYVNALPIVPPDTKLEKDCQLIGWGITETGDLSKVPRVVTIRRLSNESCKKTWPELINKGHVCFQDIGQPDASCWGDSGGPAVCGKYLVGVSSWGVSGCVKGFPSVYTRLSKFRRWINKNSF